MKDCFPCSVHPLNNKVVQHHLLLGPLNDILFHRSLGHQTININLKKILRLWFLNIAKHNLQSAKLYSVEIKMFLVYLFYKTKTFLLLS